MQTKTAKLAIEALRKMARSLAIDANLYEEGICDTPNAKNSYNKRIEIFVAISDIEAHLTQRAGGQGESPVDPEFDQIVEDTVYGEGA